MQTTSEASLPSNTIKAELFAADKRGHTLGSAGNLGCFWSEVPRPPARELLQANLKGGQALAGFHRFPHPPPSSLVFPWEDSPSFLLSTGRSTEWHCSWSGRERLRSYLFHFGQNTDPQSPIKSRYSVTTSFKIESLEEEAPSSSQAPFGWMLCRREDSTLGAWTVL